MKMFRIKLVLSLSFMYSFQFLKAQTNLSLIDEKYKQLDSVSYLNNLKEVIRRSSTYFFEEPKEDTVNRINDKIKNGINGYNIKFVLRVDLIHQGLTPIIIHSLKILNMLLIFIVMTTSLITRSLSILTRMNYFGNIYQTIELKYAKQLKAAIKRILKRKPEHILFSYYLPNTILYVNNDRVYVYRIIQKEVYELDDYVAKFKDSKSFYVRYYSKS